MMKPNDVIRHLQHRRYSQAVKKMYELYMNGYANNIDVSAIPSNWLRSFESFHKRQTDHISGGDLRGMKIMSTRIEDSILEQSTITLFGGGGISDCSTIKDCGFRQQTAPGEVFQSTFQGCRFKGNLNTWTLSEYSDQIYIFNGCEGKFNIVGANEGCTIIIDWDMNDPNDLTLKINHNPVSSLGLYVVNSDLKPQCIPAPTPYNTPAHIHEYLGFETPSKTLNIWSVGL